MIKYIKRKKIDVAKYDNCIANSIQSRVYAYSWYLDIVADNWDALVLNNYEAVMPIPWNSKYGLKYVTQPYFCQQLGIFSLQKVNLEMEGKILSKIPFKYMKVTQNLNSGNCWSKNAKERKNYILNLKYNYDILFKNFSRTRKQRVKIGFKNSLIVKEVLITDLIKIQNENYNYSGFSSDILREISGYSLNNGKGEILGVFKKEELLGGALFLKTNQRIVYLFSSFNSLGRKYQAASFLINNIIQKNQKSNLLLDFEGGNIDSIEVFFKSFGSKLETFYQYSRGFFK